MRGIWVLPAALCASGCKGSGSWVAGPVHNADSCEELALFQGLALLAELPLAPSPRFLVTERAASSALSIFFQS